jgi:hypothetical protein
MPDMDRGLDPIMRVEAEVMLPRGSTFRVLRRSKQKYPYGGQEETVQFVTLELVQ